MLFTKSRILEKEESQPDYDGKTSDEFGLPFHEDHRADVDLFRDFGDFSFTSIATDNIPENQGGKDESDDT